MERINLQNVWPEWKITRQIGRGSYGSVYEAVRTDHSIENRCAIKVITIPQSESEISSLRTEGLSEGTTKTYLQGIVHDFVLEIQMMISFKGLQNIVSVEDFKVIEKTDRIGWDIYIRMELLQPFNEYLIQKKMNISENEVIKLGIEICRALELCSKKNVIHRDVKPENIFVNSFGNFKLGDFGIARSMEHSTHGLSQKGTYSYMAPEIERGTEYDATVDLYSLGLVLYRLMNNNRLPFLFTEAQVLNPNEKMLANRKRLNGEPIPPPEMASPAFSDVILRACSYRPEDRYRDAAEMKAELIRLSKNLSEQNISSDQTLKAADYAYDTESESGKDINQTVRVRRPLKEDRPDNHVNRQKSAADTPQWNTPANSGMQYQNPQYQNQQYQNPQYQNPQYQNEQRGQRNGYTDTPYVPAPQGRKKNFLVPVCIALILLGITGIGFGVASLLINPDSSGTKTEEAVERGSRREDSEKEEDHRKKDEVTDTSASSASTAETDTDSAKKKASESDKEKDTDKKKQNEKKEEAAVYIPEEEHEEEREEVVPPAGNQSAGNQSVSSQNSSNQASGSQYTGNQSSGNQNYANQTSGSSSTNYGNYKLVNTDYLTLRSSATLTNKNNKILQIPANSELTVLETGCNGYWKVNYNGTVGYVLPSYLAPCSGAKTIQKKWDYKIITDYVTLRDIPSTEGAERTKITTGGIVEYYDSADNGFILVSYNGLLGYILTYYNGETLVQKMD